MIGTVNVGDVLATKYRVDKVLGIGGMGMVVAATHLELDQKVALKFMLPDAMRSPQAMDRFLREAKAAVKLRSEHVCKVLDVGRLESGAPYIVMEFMEGQDFADTIRQAGKLSLPDAVEYVMQALEGLAEAHANGIVHRDLKPGNLFVTHDNEGLPLVKVLDFGISKSAVAGAATKTGDVMGSPAYMSPEQMASSKNVDARADLWAMGVILYQAVSGELPFEGDTLPALCMSVMSAQPTPIATVCQGVDPGFAMVIMRCLEKTPDARYRDVGELAAALAPFGPPTAAASATRIARVLRRTAAAPAVSSAGVAPTLMSTSDALVAPTQHGTGAPAPSASSPALAAPGRISTLSASAAELSIAPTEGPKRKRVVFAGIGVALAAGLVAVVMSRGGGAQPTAPAPSTVPAAQPALAIEPPPAAAVVAPAAVQPAAIPDPTPPPPAVAPTPEPEPVHAAEVVPPSKPKPRPAHKPVPQIKPSPVVTKPEPTPPEPVVIKPPEAKPPEAKPPAPKAPESKWTHMQHDKGN